MEKHELMAEANLYLLGANPYPGRGIVVGVDESGGHTIHLYWLMGRSESSRNRILVCDEETMTFSTKLADPSKTVGQDTSLILYNAIRESKDGRVHVVSNGSQTDEVVGSASLTGAMNTWEAEPDPPNHTSRITAITSRRRNWSDYDVEFSVVKRGLVEGFSDRFFYKYTRIPAGFGRCIHTYAGDGNPLPPFQGEPFLVPMKGSFEEVAKTYWDLLDPDNKVSLAAKLIHNVSGGTLVYKIINKYRSVE